MSDVLTPEEVDALLKGVSSGAVDAESGVSVPPGEIREVDITDPEFFRRSEEPPLDFCNQVLARELASRIRPLLKNEAEVSAERPKLESYADYIAGLPRPTCIQQSRVAALENDVLFVLSAELILNYVDFYYGGDGLREGQEILDRDFTVTELGVARRLQQYAEQYMAEAWEDVLALEFETGEVETNPAFANFFPGAEPMAVSRFTVNLGERAIGWFDVLIPDSALVPHKRTLAAATTGEAAQRQSRWAAAFEAQIRETEVELHTSLGTATVSLGELVKLKVGDVLPFELPPTVELCAGPVPLFAGTFGVSNGHNAVRILGRIA